MARWFILFFVIALALPTLAVDLRSGDTVTIAQGQVINDDLVVGGGTIEMRGEVAGDLVVGGGNVNIYGPVRGNLLVAGGNVVVAGPVAGSIYLAGGNVQLSSTVGRNAVIGCGSLRVDQTATIGRDLSMSSGSVTIAGTVNRDIKSSAGSLALTETARVKRDLFSMGPDPTIAAGAVISGRKVIQPGYKPEQKTAGSWLIKIFFHIAMVIGLFIAGSVFVSVAPRLTEESETMVRAHPWASLLAGLIILIVVPIAALILMITIIGIPLAMLLIFLYIAALILAPIILAIWAGWLILRKKGSVYLALLIGLVLYLIIRLVPILGGLVGFVAMLIGLGALFLAMQGRSKNPMYPVKTPELPAE